MSSNVFQSAVTSGVKEHGRVAAIRDRGVKGSRGVNGLENRASARPHADTPPPSHSHTLIFEPLTGSHRSEFMSHLIEYIRREQPRDKAYTLVVGQGVVSADNLPAGVSVREVTSSQGEVLDRASGPFSGFVFWRILKSWLAELKPDHLVIMDLTWLELPLCFHRLPCPFSGILIVQYPELLSCSSKGRRRRIKFWWKELKTGRFIRNAKPQKIFLLNGAFSCDYLNRRFGVSYYSPIPDPVPELVAEPDFQFRSKYGIGEDRRLFLFFGSMSARKGVDRLVDAVGSLSKEAAQESAFVFCGMPEPTYVEHYHKLIENLIRNRPDICLYIEERFVSSARMRAMFEQADWILMPYTRPEYSSGILIHAAAAATPIIGPTDGLVGRQIREMGLGWNVSQDALAESIEQAVKENYGLNERARQSFVETSHPDVLAKAVLEA